MNQIIESRCELDSFVAAIESSFGYRQLVVWSERIEDEWKVLHNCWSVYTWMLNEGFGVLFVDQTLEFSWFVWSWREIGLPRVAELIEEVLLLLDSGALRNWEKIAAQFGTWEAFGEACIDSRERELFAMEDEVVRSLIDYCNRHSLVCRLTERQRAENTGGQVGR